MITLLILTQITRDEFMDFKRQVEVQFAEIRDEIKEFKTEMRAQIQALNQRIDDLITYLWIFMGFITILIGFGLWDRRTYLKPVEEKKADKELVIKLEQKIENLEDENKKLKNQNQALIFILEKFINGASKEEIKSEIEIMKKLS